MFLSDESYIRLEEWEYNSCQGFEFDCPHSPNVIIILLGNAKHLSYS